MSTVSTSELKANLTRYLREVRRGGKVLVLDRGTLSRNAATEYIRHSFEGTAISGGSGCPLWME